MPDVSWVDPLLSPEAFSPTQPLQGRGPLHPGSTWVGVQRSGRNSYEVTVKFDTVDVQRGTVTGTLEIKNLTAELESLVTFFEGDIVGEVGGPGFLTAKYGATEIDDLKHWRRFPAFIRNRLEHQLVKPNLNLRQANNKPFKFLRLKEQFVVGERVEAIHGASYAGFYYCCLDCEPFPPTDPSVSPHRSISPISRNVPAFRRRNSSFSRPEPSLLTQTRPTVPRASPASPPQLVVNLPSPQRRTVELPSTAEEPTAPRPVPPRRTSSGSISYAAALRGSSGSPGSPPLSPTPPVASSFSSSVSSASSASPQTPPEHLVRPSAPPPPDLPMPKAELDSSALSHLVEAGSSALSPILQSVAVEAGHDSEWPAPSSPPPAPARPPGLMRRMSSDVASVLAKAKAKTRGRPGVSRRKSVVEEDEDTFDDRGMRSWTEATISGFYFHHSASPYQELSLRYVPSHQGGIGDFAFR
ncbi:vesicle-mediated transport protein [Rhodotorula toruloides]|uniref:Vesicle-mediated transport protein n=1 Tax=Rhodotorula toruloides TaxID=5286 RepID=A0A511KMP9_RHOTO|nr:vesicle-mediated transport protein [Rhodotorula toruloides]